MLASFAVVGLSVLGLASVGILNSVLYRRPRDAIAMTYLMAIGYLAVATVPFLFDRYFTIWGGNVPSTLAGEFSFSLGLAIGLLFLGVLARGLETGRHRALAALLLALTGLCHLLPTIFVLVGALVLCGQHLIGHVTSRTASSGRSSGLTRLGAWRFAGTLVERPHSRLANATILTTATP